MVKSLEDITIHRVNLASSITKEFVVNSKLDDKLFDVSVEFWRNEADLIPVTLNRSSNKQSTNDGLTTAHFVMEGGSIWSRTFNKYRKIVSVNLCGLKDYTYANIRIDLPGAYRLNPEDIKQAVDTIDSFRKHLNHSDKGGCSKGVVEQGEASK